MRRIINSTNVSLDGIGEIMGGWGWHFEYVDDAFDELTWDHLAACDALLMGRRTYESFAEAWPSQAGDYADKINSMKKYVASTTLEKADWTNSTVIDGDRVEEVTKIKELPGRDILMFGFGPVAQTLLQHGLLDEIRLWVHPVLVGAGSPTELVFREGTVSTMKLVDNKTLASGRHPLLSADRRGATGTADRGAFMTSRTSRGAGSDASSRAYEADEIGGALPRSRLPRVTRLRIGP